MKTMFEASVLLCFLLGLANLLKIFWENLVWLIRGENRKNLEVRRISDNETLITIDDKTTLRVTIGEVKHE